MALTLPLKILISLASAVFIVAVWAAKSPATTGQKLYLLYMAPRALGSPLLIRLGCTVGTLVLNFWMWQQ